MDLAKYKRIFLEESAEHLRSMGDGLVALERQPEKQETIDELFRHAHSMKGMASSMGYDRITTLSHAMEDILDLVRKHERTVDGALTDLMLAALERLERLVGEVRDGDAPVTAVDDLVGRLRGVVTGEAPATPTGATNLPADGWEAAPGEPVADDLSGAAAASGSPAAAVQPAPAAVLAPAVLRLLEVIPPARASMLRELLRSELRPFHIRVTLAADSMSLGARNFVVLNRLSKAGVVLVSDPDQAKVRQGFSAAAISALVLFGGTGSELEDVLRPIPEVVATAVEMIDPAALAAVALAPVHPATGAGAGTGTAPRKRASQTVRVDTDILDGLINIVGEMLVSHERLGIMAEGSGQGEQVIDELESLGGLIHRFQETIMDVRMMPLDLVAGRLPRMVRDVARRTGKDVHLEMEGLDIELDRAILEEVGDVLMHVLRNAVDHGIEAPAARHQLNKPAEGRIGFRAYREKDWVVIQVSDDGGGIDLEAVRRTALERGLATPESLAGMDQEELMMMVTLPGFSTAKEVTDVSGRGVGLDSVRSRVESLGGALSLHSIPGEGTIVTLRLPLNVAIVRILMVEAAGQWYGIPVSRVVHLTEVTPSMVRQAGSEELFKDGRSLVNLVRLTELLGIRKPGPPRCSGPVVVVEKGRRRYGCLVDEVHGSRDAVIKPLGPPLLGVSSFTGGTILGDGRPMIILDVQRLIR